MSLPDNRKLSVAPITVLHGLDQSAEVIPQKPQQPPAAPRKMSGIQFHRVCKALEEEKARFLQERPTHERAAQILSEMTRIEVPHSAVPQLQEATGIEWTSRGPGSYDRHRDKNRVRTLLTALRSDLSKAGWKPEDMPALEALAAGWNRGVSAEGGDK